MHPQLFVNSVRQCTVYIDVMPSFNALHTTRASEGLSLGKCYYINPPLRLTQQIGGEVTGQQPPTPLMAHLLLEKLE